MSRNSSRTHFLRSQLALVLFALCLFHPTVQALDSQSHLPIEVSADEATLNDKTGEANYSGNVVITQGTTRLEAALVTITVADQVFESIVATGSPARFREGPSGSDARTEGTAQTIQYQSANAVIRFTGNAQLNQVNNSFSGEEILYDINERAIRAQGDSTGTTRVKIKYQPRPIQSDEPAQSDNSNSQTETSAPAESTDSTQDQPAASEANQ